MMRGFVDAGNKNEVHPVLDGVQYLRGLCAIIVVISHANAIIGKPQHYSKMAIPDWHIASLFAVAAFFSVSGFIIAVASLDRNGAPRTSRVEFARRRFVRIMPFLWACVVGYSLLRWLGTGRIDWTAAARTLVVWPVGELRPNVTWSLRHELLFYTFFAVALLGPRKRLAVLLAWFVASVLFYIVAYDLGLARHVLGQDWFQAIDVLMGGRYGANFQFAAGLGLGYLYLRHPQVLPLWRVPAWVMLALVAPASLLVTAWEWEHGLAVSLLWTVLATALLASAVCAAPARGWPGRLGLLLGNASFSIYLVHNPIVLVLLALSKNAGIALDEEEHLLAFLGFSVLAAVAGGILVHHFVEAPLIRICEYWTRKGTRPRARILVD